MLVTKQLFSKLEEGKLGVAGIIFASVAILRIVVNVLAIYRSLLLIFIGISFFSYVFINPLSKASEYIPKMWHLFGG